LHQGEPPSPRDLGIAKNIYGSVIAVGPFRNHAAMLLLLLLLLLRSRDADK
jgi:hypothetical protein